VKRRQWLLDLNTNEQIIQLYLNGLSFVVGFHNLGAYRRLHGGGSGRTIVYTFSIQGPWDMLNAQLCTQQQLGHLPRDIIRGDNTQLSVSKKAGDYSLHNK